MSLPYENATSGNNAINEIQKMLRSFDCAKFATGEDYETGEFFIQFEHQDRQVQASAFDYGRLVDECYVHDSIMTTHKTSFEVSSSHTPTGDTPCQSQPNA